MGNLLNIILAVVRGGPLKGWKRILSVVLLAASAWLPPEWKAVVDSLTSALGPDPLLTLGTITGVWSGLDLVQDKIVKADKAPSSGRRIAFPIE